MSSDEQGPRLACLSDIRRMPGRSNGAMLAKIEVRSILRDYSTLLRQFCDRLGSRPFIDLEKVEKIFDSPETIDPILSTVAQIFYGAKIHKEHYELLLIGQLMEANVNAFAQSGGEASLIRIHEEDNAYREAAQHYADLLTTRLAGLEAQERKRRESDESLGMHGF